MAVQLHYSRIASGLLPSGARTARANDVGALRSRDCCSLALVRSPG